MSLRTRASPDAVCTDPATRLCLPAELARPAWSPVHRGKAGGWEYHYARGMDQSYRFTVNLRRSFRFGTLVVDGYTFKVCW